MDKEIVVPEGTKVKAKFVNCERVRHFDKGLKTSWELHWVVTEGPYRGVRLKRTLWNTDKGVGVLNKDCWHLDISHPEELCLGPRPDIVIEGTASGDSLTWLDHRVFAERQPERVRGSDVLHEGKDPF